MPSKKFVLRYAAAIEKEYVEAAMEKLPTASTLCIAQDEYKEVLKEYRKRYRRGLNAVKRMQENPDKYTDMYTPRSFHIWRDSLYIATAKTIYDLFQSIIQERRGENGF